MLGFGMSNLPSLNDSFLGQYMASNPMLSTFHIGLALNLQANGADSSPVAAFNPGGSDSSPAAGVLHLYQPDPQYYVPPLVSIPTADADTTAQFGTLPSQLGSYDWTVKKAVPKMEVVRWGSAHPLMLLKQILFWISV